MILTLKKNVLPAYPRDVQSSLDFLGRVKKDLRTRTDVYGGANIDLGFEAIVRYADMENLETIGENLKPCEEYPISLHAPINHHAPETVDLTTEAGFDVAKRLVDFADKYGINLIVSHPNALRPGEFFKGGYSKAQRDDKMLSLMERALELNRQPTSVRFALENKPYPATDEQNEGVIYCPLLVTYSQLLQLRDAQLPIAFDTAHYAITRATIQGLLATRNIGKKELGKIYGLFDEDLVDQSTTSDVLRNLGMAVVEVHLNDAAQYQGVGGLVTYWEGVIPERGSLVLYRDVVDPLKHLRRDMPIVMEVVEADYKACQNTYETFKGFLEALRQ